jgi:preprotein translocase subunit SecG
MTGLIIFIHVIACALLILVILMQQGRGGGLTENFASVESIFGAKTNETLVRGTAILATIFLVTCLSMAFLSSKRSQSLMPDQNVPVTVPSSQLPAQPTAPQPQSETVPAAPAAK